MNNVPHFVTEKIVLSDHSRMQSESEREGKKDNYNLQIQIKNSQQHQKPTGIREAISKFKRSD